MNRNVESHFARLPHVDIQRSKFDRSSSHKTSFNAGRLIPLYVDEVLPGDTFEITTSKVVRMQTMLTPILDNMYLDTYWFYVPSRILWNHFKNFCGENTESAWAPSVEYSIPVLNSPEGGFESGTLADYFGLPVGVDWRNSKVKPSALPLRGYAMICSEFFRDENLTDPCNIYFGDAVTEGSNDDDGINVAAGGKPFKVSRYHDYFSSSLPNAQKGSPVTFPLGYVDLEVHTGDIYSVSASPVMSFSSGNSDGGRGLYTYVKSTDSSGGLAARYHTDSTSNPGSTTVTGGFPLIIQSEPDTPVVSGSANWPLNNPVPDNLHAIGSIGSSISVNDLRLAFAMQRHLEKMARSGSRFTELLLGIYGVQAPDASLQRPEYLGGNRCAINVHSVTNQAQSETDFLGDLGAMSVTTDIHADVQKSFSEFGYIYCLACVRYDHSYAQGLERMWTRSKFLDFYNPTFSNIGEQPVFKYELYATAETLGSDEADPPAWGFQEAFSDYRFKFNRVSGEMRPGIPNTLDSWHLSDYYTSVPSLSDEWIREDGSIIDRCLAVSSSVSNQFFGDFYFNCMCTRPMPMYSVPGLIDHH